jgi:UDP-galactopyranose mutase
MNEYSAIVVFSHLRWDFVYQRPQHLLSRLAANHRVIFIEEPVCRPDPGWEFHRPEKNVLICRPCTTCDACGFDDRQLPYIASLLPDLFEQEGLKDYVLWFYTPMALPLAEGLKPKAIIYDCMDELSAFLFAPPQLLEREAELLSAADLCFTGGPSLYQAKRNRHPRAYCFPSSVDRKHFASASNGLAEADDQASIPHPRLGFFGVIDERFDVPLLEALGRSHPEWHICLVGPVVKIDPARLPRYENIHYFGQRTYQQLPKYLKGWDVCLLPFALNQSTKFISPTKTLEYMAAGKMIVSTPITDVAQPYGDIVFLGSTPQDFIEACEKALSVSNEERVARQKKMRKVLSKTSWDTTATSMEQLIADAIALRQSRKPKVAAAGSLGLADPELSGTAAG